MQQQQGKLQQQRGVMQQRGKRAVNSIHVTEIEI